MGSYISIHNDTNSIIEVEIGDDHEALKIGGIISFAVAAVGATITGMGWAVGAMSGGLVTITATPAMAATISASSASATALSVARNVRDVFARKGYTTLKPGETYTSQKMALSLWRQCHVTRTRTVGTKVYVEETHMRPICSGPTDGSVNQHDVKFWVERYPYTLLQTFDIDASSVRGANSSDVLTAGQALNSSSNATIRSANARYRLVQQSDSHLVLYKGSEAIWANQMCGKGVEKTVMQEDGNLVSYTHSGTPVWASQTHGNPGAYLIAQNDGNLVIYVRSRPIWASNTCGRR